jgi:DNA-binding transcriptional MerR regulator
MKIIENKEYYKMAELVEISAISNHTISFYSKKGLLPQTINTSKNMKYYPQMTLTVLNLVKYFKENLNFSIDYIKELFDYYNIYFDNKEELIVQSIKMITYEIKNPIKKDDLKKFSLEKAIKLKLLEDKNIYFKTEVDVLKTFHELISHNISTHLIIEYIKSAKTLAKIEKELSDEVLNKKGFIPEILVLDILNNLKPFIFNTHTIDIFKD